MKELNLPLFPIPISIFNYGEENHQLNKDLVSCIFQEQQSDVNGSHHSNMGGWHSQTNLETKYDTFKTLSKIVTAAGQKYCNNFGYKSNVVSYDFWANINQPNDLNFNHHHGTSALAGVYYPVESINKEGNLVFNYTDSNPLKAGTWDNKNGGSLVFQDPSYGKKVQLVQESPTPYNIDFYHLYPTASVLVLFPTYLLHMVLPFTQNKTRLSISFSFKYE